MRWFYIGASLLALSLLVWIVTLGYRIETQTRERPVTPQEMRDLVAEEVRDTWKAVWMQEIVTSWTDASGVKHTVRTVRKEDESVEDWKDRHKAAVESMQEEYPPA